MRRILVLLVAVMLSGAACSSGDESTAGTGTSPAQPTIVATTPLLGELTRAVVGTEAKVSVVVPDGGDPRTYRPTDADLVLLGDADVVVATGAGYEVGLSEAIEDLVADEREVLTLAEQVSPEPCATPEGSGDVDGEGSGPSVEGVRTDPEATDTDGRPIGPAATTDACPAGVDPHVWLDADRAASMVDLLAVELGARTPLDEVLLRQRAEAYVGQIRVADERAQELLAEVPAAERILVTTVPALAYFARRHDLQLVLLADDPASVGPELSEAVAATGASSAFVSAEVLDALDAAPEVEPGKAATLVVVRTDGIATINSATDGYVGYLEQLNDEVATALAR